MYIIGTEGKNETIQKSVSVFFLCNGHCCRFGNRLNLLLVRESGIIPPFLPSIDVTEWIAENARNENHGTRQVERSIIVIRGVVKHTYIIHHHHSKREAVSDHTLCNKNKKK